ncbi:hypothetical protein [Nocardia sp. NBC_01329]|uniref:hypothetical protein n=1 Tax=Nocardia sp. NBC_01329 TaxID=2903594 RepID=UPI002E123067|nr:hypothetical protein OG405_22645 [Nocardia sp. NBC_01329]
MFSSVQQLGGAIGVAALVTVAERHGGASAGSADSAGFSFALTIAAVILVLGAVLIAALLRTDRPTPAAASTDDRISTADQG